MDVRLFDIEVPEGDDMAAQDEKVARLKQRAEEAAIRCLEENGVDSTYFTTSAAQRSITLVIAMAWIDGWSVAGEEAKELVRQAFADLSV